VAEIRKREGLAGFWKGIKPALILVSNPVVQFVSYGFLKQQLGITGSGSDSTMKIFAAGAMSKLIATLVTYPILTVKTLLQAKKGENLGVMECVYRIYKLH